MATVAIIAEYNPFHSGHEYQINKIREIFGKDTSIIAIMSGNYTQRGEIAFADKLTRATSAVLGGVNLVLELPFPYSMSSAEVFAKSAVFIASKLGCVDYLVFGSESGDIEEIAYVTEILSSKKFNINFKELNSDKSIGYAKRLELAYKKTADKFRGFEFTSNNILALEYVKALKTYKSKIIPFTLKRNGAEYNSEKTSDDKAHQSATAIRKLFFTTPEDALKYIPINCRDFLKNSFYENEFPYVEEKLAPAVIYNLRLSSSADVPDAAQGLYNRLINASFEASSISSLLSLTETKKYTNARIKRVVWYGFIGVTSSDLKSTPLFTQVLAMDSVGMRELKIIRKKSEISVLTKPSDYSHFDDIAIRQKKMSERADSVFELACPKPKSGRTALRLTPFVKK